MRSINPATGEVVADYEAHTPEQVRAIIELADATQRTWRRTTFAQRATILHAAAMRLEARKDELAELMALEMGKPLSQGLGEVQKCAWVCRYYADEAEGQLADVPIATERKSFVHYEPLGVILAVMPWNFPLWQVFRFAAPALMAGNAGVLKHASNVSGAAMAIEDVFREAGLPDGLFAALLIPSSEVAEVIEHPLVRAVTLTGSEKAGAAVAAKAGAELKKSVLELGGSDPYVVLEDADLDLAVDACAASRLINSGQSCIAAKRFIVVDAVHDAFVDKLVASLGSKRVGDPFDPATDVGPQAREDLRDELHEQVTQSIAAGAEVALGGVVPEGPGAFYPVTVLTGVRPGMPAYDDELFGPVAAVIRVADEAEAIDVANDSRYGLGAAVFTADRERGERIAAEYLEAGATFVNALVASDPRLPFGGIKQSGYGRELSALGIREFMNAKTVVVA